MDRSEAGKRGYQKTGAILKELGRLRSQQAREAYEANPKRCLQCGVVLPFEKRRGKFCSHSCSAQYNNRGVSRNFKYSNVCSCGNPKKRHNKYCKECADKHVYNKITSLAEAKYDRMRRRILIEERGWRCEVCGLSEWLGRKIPIELDHIDGDADNNTAENLRLICPNCHAQTETYKGANAGKESSRQKMRRKRYANGMTY